MKTILVVEDDTEVRVLLVRVLRDAGYQTLAAEDGTMALRVARNQHPDMILLDLNLPAGNGQFVLDSVNNSVELCGTPVVVLSGDPHLNEEDLQNRGAVAAFRKPVDQQVFLSMIARIFETSGAGATA